MLVVLVLLQPSNCGKNAISTLTSYLLPTHKSKQFKTTFYILEKFPKQDFPLRLQLPWLVFSFLYSFFPVAQINFATIAKLRC